MIQNTYAQKDGNNSNLSEHLVSAESHLKNNNYQAAYDIYQILIKTYKNSPEIYNNLAICAHQLQKPDECLNYARICLKLEPKNPWYLAQLAKFLDLDKFDTACELYEQAINLQNKNKQTEQNKSFTEKLKSDYAELLFTCGCCFAKQADKNKIAIALFEKSIQYNPNCYKPHFNLACCYINQDDYESGIKYLKQTIKLNEHHSNAHFALSQYYQQKKMNSEAEVHLKKSIDSKNINQSQAEYNYGVLEQQRKNYQKAISHYQKCIEVNHQHFAANYNIALAYHSLKNINAAVAYYEKALIIKPDDNACKYLLAGLRQSPDFNTNKLITDKNDKGTIPMQAPTEYIEELFDSYADDFENDLINKLQYKTPGNIFDIFHKHAQVSKQQNLSILDLGCGTGLIGKKFAKTARTITGVDISQNMLDIAVKKNVYNELIKADIQEFLKKNTINYNLIILADVLVYYGDLTKLFEAIASTLEQENGLLLFSIELEPEQENIINKVINKDNYKLQSTCRYTHSEEYIENLLQELGLELISKEKKVLRQQNHDSVTGMIYCYKK